MVSNPRQNDVWQGPLLLLVWSFAAAVLLWGSGVDVAVQRWLFENYHQDFNAVMRVLGEIGKGTAQVAVCLLVGGIWALRGYKAVGRVPMGAKLVLATIPVFLVAGIVNWVLKWGIGRGRPKEFLWNGSSPYRMEPFADSAQWWSFPSGHSCSTFAIAVWLMLAFPKWRWVFLWAAVILGVSRFLAVTPHFAGDVVAGGGLGAATALLVWNVVFGVNGKAWDKAWKTV